MKRTFKIMTIAFAMSIMQLDAKVLEMRLVTKDSTVGGVSVSKIAKSFKEYYDAFKESRMNLDKSEQKIIEKVIRCF
jgi:hypothetical protein